MFLLKFFYFLKGYVIIDVMEEKGALLLTKAREQNIRLWNISPSRAFCKKRDFNTLRAVMEDNEIALAAFSEVSFSHFMKKGAGGILILALATALFFVISAGYVWEIEVNGCQEELGAKVLSVLEKEGLTVGAKKRSLPDSSSLRDSIIYNIDGINWAWVYLDGTLARVEVSYSPHHEPVERHSEPSNIVASRDGVIVSVSAFSGRRCVAKGQTVSAGDILISGAMPGGMHTEPYGVFASGEVLAKTTYTKSCTVIPEKTYTHDTGEVFARRSIRIFDLEIPLSFKKAPEFTEYRVEKHTPPVGICTYRYFATETAAEPISKELAVSEAKDSLSEQIAKGLASVAKKLDEQVHTEEVGGFLKVTLTMNFIENIGTPSPIEVWQMEELANDKTN